MARGHKGEIEINVHDIIGLKCGKLQVLEYSKHWYNKTAGGDRFRHSYLCQCSCGRFVVIRRQCLLNKTVKSCGCLKKGRPNRGN